MKTAALLLLALVVAIGVNQADGKSKMLEIDQTFTYAFLAYYGGSKARCGSRFFNPSYQMCCSGVVNNRHLSRPGCCGTNSFSGLFHMCCGGVINIRPLGGPGCCGTRAFSSTYKMCCGGVLNTKPMGSSPGCCGTRAFSAAYQVCHKGQVFYKG